MSALVTPALARHRPGPGWRALLAAAAAAILALGCWALWHRHVEFEERRARLPARPAISSRPAAFAAALEQAEQRALAARSTLEGIAELGRLYQANDYDREAEVCWRILAAQQPSEAHWSHYIADLRRTAGDDAGMAAWLRETVRRAPDYAPAWLKLAEWEFKTGQLDEAERDYHRRLALLPGDPYARLGLARRALQGDRHDEGRRLLETLVRDHPTFYPAHNLLAEILDASGDAAGAKRERGLGRAAGRFREADDPWLEELRAWCYDPARLAVWASVELLTNHGDHGVALLERAIQIAPADPLGYDDLGRVYLQLGEAARARDLFAQAVKLPNAPSDAYAGLSEAYRDLGELDSALQAADQGLAASPHSADLETARGNSLRAAGRLEEALAAFRLAVEHAPAVAETHYNLGDTLLKLGRTAEAYASLRRALDLKPTYPRALIALGQGELEAGRLDSAAQYLRPLYEFNPGLELARRLMARWCLQSAMAAAGADRMEEAEQRLREGLDASPDLPELHARLGLLYGQEGRYAEALAPLETYHRLQSAEPMAALFLGQTYAHLGRGDDARRLLEEGRQLAQKSGDAATEALCEQTLAHLPP